jgi:hypothetical protein
MIRDDNGVILGTVESMTDITLLYKKEMELQGLKDDYEAMRDMYLSEPISFDEVLTTLGDLEKRINGR